MKKAIKDAKWWMFIPFTFFKYEYAVWILDGKDCVERGHRDMISDCNILVSAIISYISLNVVIFCL